MTELEYDLILANAEIRQLQEERERLLDALQFFGSCRACKHQTDILDCAVGGCNGNRNHPDNKWVWKGNRHDI